MLKKELIESVVTALVPPGAQLVTRDLGNGHNVSKVSANPGGICLIVADMFVQQLTEDTKDLPDVPIGDLFARMHESILICNQAMIGGTIIEATELEIAADHRKMIAKLRELASRLGITYKEPEDPLLEQSPGDAS